MKRPRDFLVTTQRQRDFWEFSESYERGVPEEQKTRYECIKQNAWEDSCFMGILTQNELYNQELILRSKYMKPTYFVYMLWTRPGYLFLSCAGLHANIKRVARRFNISSVQEAHDMMSDPRVVGTRTTVLLPRIKSPIFRAYARAAARDAITTWFLCAKHLGVVRDIARVIAQMVWENKESWIPYFFKV